MLQALPLVASGAADALGLSDDELALACASHNGEPAHVATAAGMLAKAGVDLGALECGAHWPHREAFQRQMAGARRDTERAAQQLLGQACRLRLPGLPHGATGSRLRDFPAGYVRAEHPVMREVSAALQADHRLGPGAQRRAASTAARSRPTPCRCATWRWPSRVWPPARGLSEGHARAARRLRQAVAKAPFMVGGSDRFDTRVMQRLGERVFCKVGAEGVYCAALPGRGLGVALKIDDGNTARAAEVAMAALIEAFVALDDGEAVRLHGLSELPLRNWNGIEVGALRASAALRAAAPPLWG